MKVADRHLAALFGQKRPNTRTRASPFAPRRSNAGQVTAVFAALAQLRAALPATGKSRRNQNSARPLTIAPARVFMVRQGARRYNGHVNGQR